LVDLALPLPEFFQDKIRDKYYPFSEPKLAARKMVAVNYLMVKIAPLLSRDERVPPSK